MTIELYHSPYSTCSQKVRLVLAEKELAFVSREINFATEDQLDPQYLRINPNGVVPTLVHAGEVIVDSSCIMEYLDEVFPVPALSPPSPVGRARMRSWMRYFEEVPTTAVRVPSFAHVFLPLISRFRNESEFEASSARRPIRRGFYEKMNSGRGFAAAELENSQRQRRQTVDRMETALAESDWLLGDLFSLADCCVGPLIDRMDDLGMADLWSDRPRFMEWLGRLRRRPSFGRAFYDGSRLSERSEFRDLVTESRESRRQEKSRAV